MNTKNQERREDEKEKPKETKEEKQREQEKQKEQEKQEGRQSHVFGRYLRQRRKAMLAFLVYGIIFGVVFFLYKLEWEEVLYASGLCGLLTAVAAVPDFCRYRAAHEERLRILRNVELLPKELPKPESLGEDDYQEMLWKLKAVFDDNMNLWQRERMESMDYYTTWVHQIKTPISVMRMILQDEDTEEHRELLAELFRIEQYVEMALNWVRLGSDSMDFVFRECDLDHIIRQAVHKYAPQFVRRRIRLSYQPVDKKVLTDEKWLLFIIEQLLSNAVKYTREGGVSIKVTEEDVLEIADTGMGIAAEDVPRIFEKGFTGYNGRADKKSTGLGLYLCSLTAKKLSHKIWAESWAGQGTVVYLDLHREKLEVE